MEGWWGCFDMMLNRGLNKEQQELTSTNRHKRKEERCWTLTQKRLYFKGRNKCENTNLSNLAFHINLHQSPTACYIWISTESTKMPRCDLFLCTFSHNTIKNEDFINNWETKVFLMRSFLSLTHSIWFWFMDIKKKKHSALLDHPKQRCLVKKIFFF